MVYFVVHHQISKKQKKSKLILLDYLFSCSVCFKVFRIVPINFDHFLFSTQRK